ncbi:biotin/lipoate--protein ligase family protein [Rhabdaerophilum sp.]|uniref:biotin/lipoate--protein ligase family protein n=1 Tax=Rhabdaerophilum sp. TaxID=2717341 RepID=UPI0038D36D3D
MLTNAETTKFPPLVKPCRLREIEDSFEIAKARAAEFGAGSMFYVGRFALIDFALVLEPEEPLRLSRKILFAGMNALAETLANIAPPELPIEFVYPASLHFDGALIGGGRIAWPEGCGEDDVPEWLVFGAMIRAGGMRDLGIGLSPSVTTLDDEGFDAWNPEEFAASFARHFMIEADSWAEKGFRAIGPRYLERLPRMKGDVKRGIDSNGDLLVHRNSTDAPERLPLLSRINPPEWYDPAENEPRG